MYIEKVFQFIDSMAERSFVDEKMDLQDDVVFFLERLNSLKGHFTTDMPFEEIRGAWTSSNGRRCCKIIGLSLKKTDWNSCGNLLSPKFIEFLKATTRIYLTSLSCRWEDVADISQIRDYFSRNSGREGPDFVVIYNKFHSYDTLQEIAKVHKLLGRVDFLGDTTGRGSYVGGDSESLQRFIKILKEESPMPMAYELLKVAKTDINCNFYVLPGDIIEEVIQKVFDHTFNRFRIV
jgi:hypothetical protein